MEFEKFENLDQMLEALKKVKKVDLTKNEATPEEALAFCTEVMIILGKYGEHALCNIDIKDMPRVSQALVDIGCAPYNSAHPSYIHKNLTCVGESIGAKGAIDFPLSAFTQLIGSTPSSFTYGASKLLDGDFEHSWLGRWLQAQGIKDPNAHYAKILEAKSNDKGEM